MANNREQSFELHRLAGAQRAVASLVLNAGAGELPDAEDIGFLLYLVAEEARRINRALYLD